MKNKVLIIIGIIIIAIMSLTFLLVRVTDDFIIGYLFSVAGALVMLITSALMMKRKEEYSYVVSIPATGFIYFLVSVIFSVVIIVLDQLNVFTLDPTAFAIIEAAILAVFIIIIISLYAGTKHIKITEDKLKAKTNFIKTFKVDIEILANRTEDTVIKEKIQKLTEAIRFSDPVSSPELYGIEEEMKKKADELKGCLNNSEQASEMISAITLLLEERNAKCKILK